MELVEPLEPADRSSAIAAARLRRQMTREEAAKRAGISVEQAEWLEDGRLYRFATGDEAVLAAMLYATALRIGPRELRRMGGLPVGPRSLGWNRGARLAVATCGLLLAATLAALLAIPRVSDRNGAAPVAAAKARALPAPWRISIVALNGSGDIANTRQVANRIAALGYRIVRVAKASRFDYPQTVVYFSPGGQPIAERLAATLGVGAEPLPGGRDPLRLVVIVGPSHL